MLRVGVASSFGTDALRPYSLIGRKGTAKIHRRTRSPRTIEFCNTVPPNADIDRRDGNVRFVPKLAKQAL